MFHMSVDITVSFLNTFFVTMEIRFLIWESPTAIVKTVIKYDFYRMFAANVSCSLRTIYGIHYVVWKW